MTAESRKPGERHFLDNIGGKMIVSAKMVSHKIQLRSLLPAVDHLETSFSGKTATELPLLTGSFPKELLNSAE